MKRYMLFIVFVFWHYAISNAQSLTYLNLSAPSTACSWSGFRMSVLIGIPDISAVNIPATKWYCNNLEITQHVRHINTSYIYPYYVAVFELLPYNPGPGDRGVFQAALQIRSSSGIRTNTATVENGSPKTHGVSVSTDQWNSGDPISVHDLCPRKDVVFVARPEQEDYDYTYRWNINGVWLEGEISQSITLSPQQMIAYRPIMSLFVEISGTDECGRKISSRSVTGKFNVQHIVNASVFLSIKEKACESSDGIFMVHPTGGGSAPYYEWFRNNQSVSRGYEPTITIPNLSLFDTIWVRMNSSESCVSQAGVLSNKMVHDDYFFRTPQLTVSDGCNRMILNIDLESGYDYYFQSSATSKETNKPFIPYVTRPGTVYVRGIKNDQWGCTSDPVVITEIPVGVSCDRNYIRERIIQQEGITDGQQINFDNASIVYTYYDGIGRPIQSVLVDASPAKNDVVTPITYDRMGPQDRQWLPYEAGAGLPPGAYHLNDTSVQKEFYSTGRPGIPDDTRPWSQTIFESSPLSRPRKQYGPGQAWATAGKHVATGYLANVQNEVRLWQKNGNRLNVKGYYDEGTLYKKITTDEDGNRSVAYTDLNGLIIRKDRIQDGKTVTTEFVYDDYGRQVYVIQPAYFDAANKATYQITENDAAFSNWVFAYHYDPQGRVFEKHIPGGGWTSIVYNRLDQPVMAQSAEQAGREWNFTKYDVHGRIIQTGVLNDTARRSIWQGKVDSDPDLLWETRMVSGGVEGYTNHAQPEINASHVMVVNYYDKYDFAGSGKWSGADDRVHGLQTGSRVRILDSNDWLVTTLSYDNKGRVVHSVSDNIKGGKDRITNEYDFTGKLLSSKREHTGKEPVTLTMVNKYDHAGRLLTVKQHIGGDTITVASNSYNALGQLVQARHHENPSAGTAAETVNYDYNIRGWLTSIDGDLFKERLHYQDPAGTFGTLVKGQWGGNISSVEWYAPKINKYWHLYGYSYNELGFLTNSRYARSNTLSDNTYNTNKNHNDEWYTYDLNGNVKTLNRKHLNRYIDQLNFTYDGNRLGGMSDKTVIDPEKTNTGMIPITSLPAQGTYASCGGYEITGNFLMEGQFTFEVDPSLCDGGVTGTTSYNYDASGRMTKDTQDGSEITYNHLNLIKQVKKDGKTLKYTYDATGRKLKTTPPTGQVRTYIDGIEYKGDAIEFISTPYGRIRKNGLNSWVYDYFLKDHLGNIRVVATTDPVNTQVYRATMEVSSSEEESRHFEKLDETRSDRPYNYPDVNPANAKVAKVAGKSEGPKLTLKVMAGDTISISAQAFYNIDRTLPGQGADIVPVVGSAIAALAGGAMVPAGEAASLALDLGATASTSAALSQLPQDRQEDEGTQPESGLHFVLYNEQMDVVEANTGILPVDDRINKIQDLSSDRIVIQESGYLEVFVNNEAQTPVYYDNLVVMQSTGNVIEVNAYYPYGKIIQGLSTSSTYGKNNYKYNGKELQTDMDWNRLDYGARMLPTSHPMWFVPDAYAEKYYSLSPYSYAAGNPINVIDINGDSLWIKRIFRRALLYEDGNLYNKDGTAYSGKQTGFLKKTVAALNKTRGSGGTGERMVSEIQKSKFNITIKRGASNSYSPDNGKSSLNVQAPGMFPGLVGSGGTIKFNPNSRQGGMNTLGNRNSQPFIGLAHELAHSWDAIDGNLNLNEIPGQKFTYAEHFATNIENKIRAENGMPLRTHYGYNATTNSGFYPILQHGQSIFYGNNYYQDLMITPLRIVIPVPKPMIVIR